MKMHLAYLIYCWVNRPSRLSEHHLSHECQASTFFFSSVVSDALLLLSLALTLMTARKEEARNEGRRMSKDQEGRNIHEERREEERR